MRSKVVAICLLLLLGYACVMWFSDAEQSSTPFLRLHVVAHSDLEHDQYLKELIRDEILAQIKQLSLKSEPFSLETLANHLPAINKSLQKIIVSEGRDYPLNLQLGRFNFPTKSYDQQQFILPAGQYPALNVIIGAGQGRNWWCVLFPSLCVTSEAWEESAEVIQEVVVTLQITEEVENADLTEQIENNTLDKS